MYIVVYCAVTRMCGFVLVAVDFCCDTPIVKGYRKWIRGGFVKLKKAMKTTQNIN